MLPTSIFACASGLVVKGCFFNILLASFPCQCHSPNAYAYVVINVGNYTSWYYLGFFLLATTEFFYLSQEFTLVACKNKMEEVSNNNFNLSLLVR